MYTAHQFQIQKLMINIIIVVLLYTDVSTEMSPELELMKNEELTPHGTNDSVANPFLQENAPDSMLESGLLEDVADTVASLGEPTLASLGLGGYSPAGLIQQALELIHVSGNVSWCLSIVIFTLIVRTVCLPLIIKAQANTAKLNNIRPQLEEAQAKLRELANSQDAAAKATASMKLAQLYKDNGCHPMKVPETLACGARNLFQPVTKNCPNTKKNCSFLLKITAANLNVRCHTHSSSLQFKIIIVRRSSFRISSCHCEGENWK